MEEIMELTTDEMLLQMVAELDFRLCLMELGVNPDDL